MWDAGNVHGCIVLDMGNKIQRHRTLSNVLHLHQILQQ